MGKSDLQSKVEEWLKEQGYPLEMRTAQVFHRRGWFLHHSRRYKDPTSGKEREIDLLAFNDDKANTSQFHGHLVIECKWTPKKPWVLFTSTMPSLNPIGYFRSTAMTRTAARAVESLFLKDVSGYPLFSGHEEGYAIVQALSKSQAVDAAYSAVQSAVNAADFFASNIIESTEHAIVYVPTVILDGELFQCSLSEDKDISVSELDMGLLIHHTSDLPRCVHIVRESALEEFIDRAETTFKSLWIDLKKR